MQRTIVGKVDGGSGDACSSVFRTRNTPVGNWNAEVYQAVKTSDDRSPVGSARIVQVTITMPAFREKFPEK